MKKKKSEGGGPVGGPVVGGQGGCERRIEVIVKMQKNVGCGPGPVRGGGGGQGGRGWLVARLG